MILRTIQLPPYGPRRSEARNERKLCVSRKSDDESNSMLLTVSPRESSNSHVIQNLKFTQAVR